RDERPPLAIDDFHVRRDLTIRERRKDPGELLGSLWQRGPRCVERPCRQLCDDARFVLGAALGEDGRARGEAVDDDDGKRSGQGQRRRRERQEYLQPEGEAAAARLDQARDRQREPEDEHRSQRDEQLLATGRHSASLSRYPTPRTVSSSFGSPPASSSLRRSALTWTSTVRSPTTTSLPQTASRS